jgi:predicted RND superfamily exporter protein
LGKNLSALLRDRPQELLALNRILMGDYPERLKRLELSLEAESFNFDDLPQQMRAESEARDGRIKVSLYPEEDLTNPAALTRFVKNLATHHDAVGGRPAGEYEVGALMVRSFTTALVLALIGICALLLLSLGSLVKTIFALAPIVLTAIWALALCVLFGIAFNFVNVLMLPLLLGLGVANGIHILSRADKQNSLNEVMHSSTPVAVFLSNATTLASFGSMSVATHWGLQSMGIILAMTMVLMMFSVLIILPAFLAWHADTKAAP